MCFQNLGGEELSMSFTRFDDYPRMLGKFAKRPMTMFPYGIVG
jgi:hypothetical protein